MNGVLWLHKPNGLNRYLQNILPKHYNSAQEPMEFLQNWTFIRTPSLKKYSKSESTSYILVDYHELKLDITITIINHHHYHHHQQNTKTTQIHRSKRNSTEPKLNDKIVRKESNMHRVCSVVLNIDCSFREPRLYSQHLHCVL